MIPRGRVSIVSFIFCFAACPAVAQESPPPDLIVTLNEGIYHYLMGQIDEDNYTVAVELLTSVVERQPDNATALLFRALSYGRRGLVSRSQKLDHFRTPALLEEVLGMRASPELVDELRREIAAAEAALAGDGTGVAQRKALESQLLHHRALLEIYNREKDKPDADLRGIRQQAMTQYYSAARRERAEYQAMIEDLKQLLRAVQTPQAVLRLLEVVAEAKVARADEEEARALVRGEIQPAEAAGSVEPLRAAAGERLNHAAEILQALLGEPLDGPTTIRAKFFLAVIRYRQAVPVRAESEKPAADAHSRSLLEDAERLMAELADDETTDVTWRSYAALYLGIIIPFRAAAAESAAARDSILDEAAGRIQQASLLDATQQGIPTTIPDLVWRQNKLIAELRRAAPIAPLRKDLSLSLFSGTRYDTNVVLLGERTDLPRDISRESDFGFTFISAADYTWDITDRLTLGLQGRTSQLWNVDVHEFDQQAYGASAALQYEISRQAGDNGPVLLALQYDFDYTLLGRDGFLESHALTPSLRCYWSDHRAQTDLFVVYQIRDYSEPLYDRRFNRDGVYGTVGIVQQLKTLEMTSVYKSRNVEPWGHKGDPGLAQDSADFPDYPERYVTPYLGLSYSWDSTRGDEFDRRAEGLTAGVEFPLPWGVELDTSAGFEWEEYPQHSLNDLHRRVRRDLVQEYGLVLSRTFVLRAGDPENRYMPAIDRLVMTIRAHAIWTIDDSNVVDRSGQAIYSYDRAVYGLSVAFAFN